MVGVKFGGGGRFYFHFILVFYILGAFSMKQNISRAPLAIYLTNKEA